jgi:hypothetical protein
MMQEAGKAGVIVMKMQKIAFSVDRDREFMVQCSIDRRKAAKIMNGNWGGGNRG